MRIDLPKLTKLLPLICSRDTSFDPRRWTEENPLWGHCAVVALLVQDFLGGEILRVSLKDVPEYASVGSHFLNRLPDGSKIDLTYTQFQKTIPTNLKEETREREQILSRKDTSTRYLKIRRRLDEILQDIDTA